MLTEEKEDYLKAVYTLGGTRDFVANKKLADYLNIKPPSVTEMMTRLQKEGFVTVKAYKGTMLTTLGKTETLRLIKRHRLIECFLIESLGYTWDEVHEEAEILEHRVSDKFIDRLDKMLDYPKYCPHGSLIPRGSETEEDAVSIINLNAGDAFKVKKVRDEYMLLQYLSDKGVNIGDTLEIEAIDASNRIIYVKNDETFVISFENAEKIFYEQ